MTEHDELEAPISKDRSAFEEYALDNLPAYSNKEKHYETWRAALDYDRREEPEQAARAESRQREEALRADAERLDWCEGHDSIVGDHSKDMGDYFEIRTGGGTGNLRERISAAIAASAPAEQGEGNER